LTNDYGALGAERSDLQQVVNAVLGERKMTFAPDARPEQGSFFPLRSFSRSPKLAFRL
jgi:hypothetical protein